MYSWKGEVMFRENWEEAFPADTSNTNASKSSDDIVTRLADSACVSCYECVCGMCVLLSDAVDEIKQLRAEVARLNSLLHPAGMSAIDKVEHLHDQIVRIVKGYND